MLLAKEQHLDASTGPKRILALDGGGIRGVLMLQFLQAIESLIKKRFGDNTLLCDYFDLIGGTSTGSIIAAGLACGMTVDALQENSTGLSTRAPSNRAVSVGSFLRRLSEHWHPSSRPGRYRRSSIGSSAQT